MKIDSPLDDSFILCSSPTLLLDSVEALTLATMMLSAIKDSSSLLDLAVAGLGFFALYQLYLYLTVGASRRKVIEENGCKPPVSYPHSGPFGIKVAFMAMKDTKQRTVLKSISQRFLDYGNTVKLKLMGRDGVLPILPFFFKKKINILFPIFSVLRGLTSNQSSRPVNPRISRPSCP